MDLFLDILKHIAWVVVWLFALFIFAMATLPGGGRRNRAPKWFAEKHQLVLRLKSEARKISTPAEKEAFIRKLDECRPRLWKDEKKSIIRCIGQKPPRPNYLPTAVRSPIKVIVQYDDPNDVGSR